MRSLAWFEAAATAVRNPDCQIKREHYSDTEHCSNIYIKLVVGSDLGAKQEGSKNKCTLPN
jgi:hypothetical protein